MAQRNRETLKQAFKQGSKPHEKDFENLIDSMMNILDDGISKTEQRGLNLSPGTENGTVLSISQAANHLSPLWRIAISQNGDLEIRHCRDTSESPTLTLKNDGSLALGNENKITLLHGVVHSKFREGTLYKGNVPADGKWHDITDELADIQALEVVAFAGRPGDRKQSVVVAVATSCSGRHTEIGYTMSYSGYFIHKTRLRWKKIRKTDKAKLQAKTVWKYGSDKQIHYNITGLVNYDHTET
jgi:hypothetical protein